MTHQCVIVELFPTKGGGGKKGALYCTYQYFSVENRMAGQDDIKVSQCQVQKQSSVRQDIKYTY